MELDEDIEGIAPNGAVNHIKKEKEDLVTEQEALELLEWADETEGVKVKKQELDFGDGFKVESEEDYEAMSGLYSYIRSNNTEL